MFRQQQSLPAAAAAVSVAAVLVGLLTTPYFPCLPPYYTPAKFEEDAGRYWDLFYKRNSDRFFKDRHYFDKEWPQLTREHITVLEVCFVVV